MDETSALIAVRTDTETGLIAQIVTASQHLDHAAMMRIARYITDRWGENQ